MTREHDLARERAIDLAQRVTQIAGSSATSATSGHVRRDSCDSERSDGSTESDAPYISFDDRSSQSSSPPRDGISSRPNTPPLAASSTVAAGRSSPRPQGERRSPFLNVPLNPSNDDTENTTPRSLSAATPGRLSPASAIGRASSSSQGSTRIATPSPQPRQPLQGNGDVEMQLLSASTADDPQSTDQQDLLPPDSSTLFTEFLQGLGIDENKLRSQANIEILERLRVIETSGWSTFRWMRFITFLDALVSYLCSRESDFRRPDDLHSRHNRHVWFNGAALPFQIREKMRRVLGVRAFFDGMLSSTYYAIHASLFGLLCYQIIVSIYSGSASSLEDFFKNILLASDENGILAALRALAQSPSDRAGLTIVAAPFIVGAINAGVQARPSALPQNSAELQKLLDEIQQYPTNHPCWRYLARPALPRDPLIGKLEKLFKLLSLDGTFTIDERKKMIATLLKARHRGGLTEHQVMNLLAKLSHVHSMKDLKLLGNSQLAQALLAEKAACYQIIVDAAINPLDAFKKEGLKGLARCLHAHYWRWALADSSSKGMRFTMAAYQTTKTTISLLLIKTVLQTLAEFASCPQRPGFNLVGGFASWSADFTEACFGAFVALFNKIPGQPLETLTAHISEYHIISPYALDLSNKNLNGTDIATIINAFVDNNITISSLNVSGNALNTVQDVRALMGALPTSVTSLDMSNCAMEEFSSEPTKELARWLPQTQLTEFYYANNAIGYLPTEDSTPELMASLPVTLRKLGLDGNWIGYWRSSGIIAPGLARLRQLEYLDLAFNILVGVDDAGAIAVCESLPLGLKFFGASFNIFGYRGGAVTKACAARLAQMPHLQDADLSNNLFGYQTADGIPELAQAVLNAPALTSIEVAPVYNGTNILAAAIRQRAIPSDMPIISTATDAQAYIQSLPANTTAVNLSGKLSGITPDVLQALLEGLAERFPGLTGLDVSGNELDNLGNECSTYIAAILPRFTELNDLNLASSGIMKWGALGPAIASSTKFRRINLKGNNIGINFYHEADYTANVIALLEAIGQQRDLVELNLNETSLDNDSSIYSSTLGRVLPNLSELQILRLFGNAIENTDNVGATALCQAIGTCTKLQVLDLSGNDLGKFGSQSELALAESLGALNLQTLNLGGNQLGKRDAQGPRAILATLPSMSNLQEINLNNMQNVSWSQGADALRRLTNEILREACESELCFFPNSISVSSTPPTAAQLAQARQTPQPIYDRRGHAVSHHQRRLKHHTLTPIVSTPTSASVVVGKLADSKAPINTPVATQTPQSFWRRAWASISSTVRGLLGKAIPAAQPAAIETPTSPITNETAPPSAQQIQKLLEEAKLLPPERMKMSPESCEALLAKCAAESGLSFAACRDTLFGTAEPSSILQLCASPPTTAVSITPW